MSNQIESERALARPSEPLTESDVEREPDAAEPASQPPSDSASDPPATALDPVPAAPEAAQFESEDEVHAALAAWAGRKVGAMTPEEGRERGYRPAGDRPSVLLPRVEAPAVAPPPRAQRERSKQPRPRRPPQPAEELGPEQAGRIKWFSMEKGYGFVQPESGAEDVFVHVNQFRSRPEQVTAGARVTFRLGHGRKGKLEAKQVQVEPPA